MDFSKITLFTAMKRKLAWLAQRHEVLAQNVANADTPGAKAMDIAPFKFGDLVRQQSMPVNMAVTSANHLASERREPSEWKPSQERRPYETAPAGNAVVLEEQMMKLSENELDYKLTTELYRKHIGLFRKALGRPS